MPKAVNETNDSPPDYPNGWIPVLEMREIKNNEIKNIRAFGHQLVVFKGNSNKTYVLNAFCPHLGANLGVGGEVTDENGDECIKCPFHGWSFRGADGLCVKIPELNASEIPMARVKVWQTIEVNQILFVWYHSEDLKPNWFPKPIIELQNNTWKYEGRTEHTIECHIQGIPENSPDVSHFNIVHANGFMSGSLLDKMMFGFLSNLYQEWDLEWRPSDVETHIATMELYLKNRFFGFSLFEIQININQIGPTIMEMRYKTKLFGGVTGIVLQLQMPIGPNLTKVIDNSYSEPTFFGKMMGKLTLYTTCKALLQDTYIWNNRIYRGKSAILTKKEKNLVTFRRWFRQFYSEFDL